MSGSSNNTKLTITCNSTPALKQFFRNAKKKLWGHPGKAIDPQLLENEGFDFNLTKSKMTIIGNAIEIMNKYGYRFTQNQQIILCKI